MAIGSHEPDGETVGLHTLCVHPDWRARGLGTMILKEYINRVSNEKNVKRVALIAHDELVPFYEKYYPFQFLINCRAGFVNHGLSNSKYGGVTWNDCIYTFNK
jgi:GNAT superfamily N-acetyltransferase